MMHLDEMLENFIAGYKGDSESSKDFLEYVRKEIGDGQTEEIYQLSDQALFQINNLTEGLLDNVKKESKDIIATKNLLEKKISELDSYLTLDINDKQLQEIYKKIKKAEQKLIDDQVKMSELEQLRTSANSLVLSTSAEFSKYVEAYLSNAELRDSTERTIKYSNMALSIIEKYQIELQKRKTGILAETITDCYKKLANKKNLIQRIEMDPENLNMVYLSEEGKEVQKDSLSAGEQQLMVISILWALAICSKKKLPVIIDTPLSRLDSLHRTALIDTYFPNAGEQTIILSTDSEIDNSYYELMKENVGDEFTLIYDENTKSTSIERGYLIGAKI
jgi:DNA sulfur modification protein DndD